MKSIYAQRNSADANAASRALRVLMIAPTSFFADYGCHVRILEEARVLQRLGHQVTIATYHNGSAVPGLDIRRTSTIPWRHDYVVGSSRHKIAFDALLGLKTLHLLFQERFDVVHAHLHEGALIGLVAGRLFGRPVVFDFQGSMTSEMLDHHFLKRQGIGYKLLHWLETRIDRCAPVILTSTLNAQELAGGRVRLPARRASSPCPIAWIRLCSSRLLLTIRPIGTHSGTNWAFRRVAS